MPTFSPTRRVSKQGKATCRDERSEDVFRSQRVLQFHIYPATGKSCAPTGLHLPPPPPTQPAMLIADTPAHELLRFVSVRIGWECTVKLLSTAGVRSNSVTSVV